MGEVREERRSELNIGSDFGHGGGGGLDILAKVEEDGCESCAGLGQGESTNSYGEGVHGIAVTGWYLLVAIYREQCTERL